MRDNLTTQFSSRTTVRCDGLIEKLPPKNNTASSERSDDDTTTEDRAQEKNVKNLLEVGNMIATTYVSPLCGFLTFTRYSDIVECTDSVDGLVRFV